MEKQKKEEQSFLPLGFELPEPPSDYVKMKEGSHKLRILSAPIMGYEYWAAAAPGEKKGKPVRAREMWRNIPLDADISKRWDPTYFWAMVVWNHTLQCIQIWQPKQKTILSALTDLINNPDWGDPRTYNLTITRKGTKIDDTEYSVQPSPHSDTPKEALALYKEKNIDLNALFEGKNPFEASERSEEIDAKDFRPSVVKKQVDAKVDEEEVPF